MTNQEALEKAIKIAIDNGWNMGTLELATLHMPAQVKSKDADEQKEEMLQHLLEYQWFKLRANSIIYNHDFAKALWPNVECDHKDGVCGLSSHDRWKHHLQQMVISEDPLKYLAGNLPDLPKEKK